MNRPPLRVGIAGLGFGAQAYIPVLVRNEDAKICALADGGSDANRRVAALFSEPPRYYSSGQEMMDAGDIDCVFIVTPPAAQAALIMSAFTHGIPFLCEKPCGQSLAQCAELMRSSKRSKLPAAIGFEYRYEPGISDLIGLLKKNRIGDIRTIDVQWHTRGGLNPQRLWSWRDDRSQGGGILNEFCSHIFDYLPLLAGAPVDEVSCTGQTVVESRPDKNGHKLPVRALDEAQISCLMKNNVAANIHVTNAALQAVHRIDVTGDSGRARFEHCFPFENGGASLIVEDDRGQDEIPLRHCNDFHGIDSRASAIDTMTKDFFFLLQQRQAPMLAKLSDALSAQECIAAAESAILSGSREIIRDRIAEKHLPN